jgi:hypothetical protein
MSQPPFHRAMISKSLHPFVHAKRERAPTRKRLACHRFSRPFEVIHSVTIFVKTVSQISLLPRHVLTIRK